MQNMQGSRVSECGTRRGKTLPLTRAFHPAELIKGPMPALRKITIGLQIDRASNFS